VRVGLLIYGSIDTISGGYLYDRVLVAHLRRRGHTVQIVSLPWRNYPRHLLDNFSKSLLHKLRQLAVDVLIQDELNHPSMAWLNDRLHLPFPIISLVHHLRCDELRPTWQNTLYRQVERRYLDSVGGFIFNSRTTQKAVDRVSRINDRPWVIATPAGDWLNPEIEADEITNRAHLNGPLRLIFLGNLIPRKGLHTLIEALSQLPLGAHKLEVVGDTQVDPDYTRRIHRQIKGHGLETMVNFRGALDDSALAGSLRRSHVLVVPSSYEGFGIVYLEGMGFGLPVIGTTKGAAPEIIHPGKSGYLIEAGDSSTLSTILAELHKDRPHLATLSLAARQRYSQFPGWEQSMEKIRAFLHHVTGMQI
jgi:glycosyltransferase involved in cell wall biosynthesis